MSWACPSVPHQSGTARRGLRFGAPDRRAAGPAHPPRPHPGDERRELPTQAQQGNRRVPSSRRSRGRIARTANAVSTCSFNVPTPTNLLPSVITSVVHDHTAPVAQYLGAIDTIKKPSKNRIRYSTVHRFDPARLSRAALEIPPSSAAFLSLSSTGLSAPRPPLAFPCPNTRKGCSCQSFSIQLYALPLLAQLHCFLI